jgi:hypothetical protein
VDRAELLQALLDGVLQPEDAVRERDEMRFEGTEARLWERGLDEPPEARAREVVVAAHERHLYEQARVVAVRLDDERRPARTEDAPVLGQGTDRIVHVMQRVLRVDEVEGSVFERERLGVRRPESETGLVGPLGRGDNVDRDDLADTLAEEPCDSAVAAADVEKALATAKRVLELVDAPKPVAEFTRGRVGR